MISVVVTGCSTTGSYTSNAKFSDSIIGPIERKEIAYQGPYRNPIIIVHGFLGANLVDKKTGKNIWGKFVGANAFTVSNERMRALAIPMKRGTPLTKLNDDVDPDGVLDTVTVKIMGMTFKENAYQNLINILASGGFQPEGQPLGPGKNYNTLFMFAYDWRRDLQWNAVKLHEFIMKKRKYIQNQYKIMYGKADYDVQFDLMGHSMGGLVARYYLRYGTADLPPEGQKPKITWAGSKFVDRVIIMGTPNAGYLDTVWEMVKGSETPPPLPPAVLGTWPTYYQMMPVPARKSVIYADTKKPVDMFDIKTWLKMKWGLADPKQAEYLKILLPNIKDDNERRRLAFDHLGKCLKRAKRFIEVMGIPAKPPQDVLLYLVLGNAVKTRRFITVDPKTGALTISDDPNDEYYGYAPGDGKVTQSSALFDERAGQTWKTYFSSPIAWKGIIQLRAAHMGITTDPAFKDNILFLLNAIPTKRKMEEMNKVK